MDALVSTAWLAEHLGQPGLLVFDATKYLPTEAKDATALFEAAHIPGARFFDVDVVADPDTTLPHMAPSPGRFETLMRQMGVTNDSRIVFYDQKGLFSAGRAWWLMGLFGHDAAAVLDGGLPKWQAEARPVEAGPAATPTPTAFTATYRPTRLRGLGDMLAPDPGTIVLDARAAARFSGQAPEPRPGLPSGHMPGSRNLPATALLAPDGTMLPPDRLRALFATVGVDGTSPVTTSCGTGITATILTLGLQRAGFPTGAVYDGSWTEWAARPDTIKETT